MSRINRLALTLALSLIATAFAAGQAIAVTTVGSALTSAPNTEFCTSMMGAPSNCTMRQTALASGAVSAPSNGVIVRWRVRLGAGSGFLTALSLRPRVVRGNLGVSSGTAQTFTMPLAAGTREFSERLPVQSGDSLALDVSTNSLIAMIIPAGAPMMHAAAGVGSFEMWSPPLLDGSTTAPLGGPIANQEPLYNADIEPDVDADGFGDETQDLCPAVASLQTTCVTTAISKLKLKRGLGFSLTISEASSLDLLVERLTPGRLRGGKCSTRAKRGARCSVAKRVKSIKNLAAGSGPVVIPYSTAKLKAGRYRVTVTAHNPNGLTSSKSAGFKIK